MATTSVYGLCLLFLFCLFLQGNSQCTGKENLKVSQAPTGKLIQNKPEFNVTIYNDCICTELNVYLGPEDFHTVEPIDPKILAKTPLGWLVNDGQPIYGNKSFSFTYAWNYQFNFVPVGATRACS
ncbi:hypothetical protein K2173_024044 [Erythroxylum novogranatense]|uniref:Uncharacterized protein n=1 Tax=Erythroxylum novogranatense TaxID=1862640 RepID=A0AAV8TQU5_9ROSI|nr:hypothetical protein K2173_024044 [Erythroxylum novogranatense]